jgi:hypothetical protein
MSEAATEALESEAYEGSESESEATGEAFGEAFESEAAGEAGYGEASRDDAQRRRQRQIMMARMAQQFSPQLPPPPRPGPPRPAIRVPTPAVRQVRSEIRSLDLDTKVALDSLRNRLNRANRLAYRNAWAAEAGVAASQALDSFGDGLEPHDWARAIIRGAPTLLIAPGEQRRRGLEGVLFDPRVAGGALIAAIWAFGHFRNASKGVHGINIANPSPLTVGDTGTLSGIPVDGNGQEVQGITVTWASSNSDVLSVDPSSGTYDARDSGSITVTASADKVSIPIAVRVNT